MEADILNQDSDIYSIQRDSEMNKLSAHDIVYQTFAPACALVPYGKHIVRNTSRLFFNKLYRFFLME